MSTRKLAFVPMLVLAATLAGCATQPAPTEEGTLVTAPEPGERTHYQVFFDNDSAVLNEEGKAVIASIAQVAANNEKASVRLIGKTDRVGATGVNLALSKKRTDVVLEALVAAGVPTKRIDWGWTGERGAIVRTADEKSEPRNRVVEISVAMEPG